MRPELRRDLITLSQVRKAREAIPHDPANHLNGWCYVQIDKTRVYAAFQAITVGLPVWHYGGAFEDQS